MSFAFGLGSCNRNWLVLFFILKHRRSLDMASGGRRGLAQSIFQVGGNMGSSVGPKVAVILIIVP